MKIDHINIVTNKIDEHVAFFVNLFQYKVTLDTTLRSHWIDDAMNKSGVSARCIFLESDKPDNCRIELLEFMNRDVPIVTDSCVPAIDALGIRHFAIEVDDIEKTVAAAFRIGYSLYSAKIVAVPADVIPHGKKLVYLNGRENIIIEICQYGHLVK